VWHETHCGSANLEADPVDRLLSLAAPSPQMVQTVLDAACALDGRCVSWSHSATPFRLSDRDNNRMSCARVTEHMSWPIQLAPMLSVVAVCIPPKQGGYCYSLVGEQWAQSPSKFYKEFA